MNEEAGRKNKWEQPTIHPVFRRQSLRFSLRDSGDPPDWWERRKRMPRLFFDRCLWDGFDELKGVTECACLRIDSRRRWFLIATSVERRSATVTGPFTLWADRKLAQTERINSRNHFLSTQIFDLQRKSYIKTLTFMLVLQPLGVWGCLFPSTSYTN